MARSSAIFGWFVLTCWAAACSPAGADSTVKDKSGGTGGSKSGGGSGAGSGNAAAANSGPILGPISEDKEDGPCRGLECAVQVCPAGTTTSLSGKVYDPAGKLPLYNVLVYVPNGPVPAFKDGISCDRCAATVTNPVTAAVTDESGSFKLEKVPSGANIPLVIQVGKWRRQVSVASVTGCTDQALPAEMTRLPRSKAEGDLPRIAIAAGGADQMECLPRRLGVADSEFTTSAGEGRIHLYTATDNANDAGVGDLSVKAFDATLNGGAMLPHSTELWGSLESLRKYDIVVLSCEGTQFANEKPMPSRQALYDYASQGGRIFASHWAHVWFSQGPQPVPTTGEWNSRNNPADAATPVTATINQSFPKGAALAKWLVNVGASTTPGQLTVLGARDNIQAVNPALAREWITVENPNYPAASKTVEYMSFNTPLGASEEMACGRAVFTGLHVSTSVEDETMQPTGFPSSCPQSELSAQEKAVAFMLFDLSACIQSDEKPPIVPK
jgi:hypothetical protein